MLLLAGLLTVPALLAAISCKKSTSVRATYVTNFGCQPSGSLTQPVFFAIARVGEPLVFDGKLPRPEHAETCIPAEATGDATVGDLAVTPNPDYAGAYDLVAIVGSDKEETGVACGLGGDFRPRVGADGKPLLGGAHCVVARRRVRFVEGQEIAQRILLSKACAGVLCPDGTTCNPETRMCTRLVENPTSPTGGAEMPDEVDAGPSEPPGPVDASVPDARVETDAPVVPTCRLNRRNCGGIAARTISTPTPMGAEPNAPWLVAASGRVAIIPASTRITEYVPATGGQNELSAPFGNGGSTVRRIAYTGHGGQPTLAAVVAGAVGGEGIVAYAPEKTLWDVKVGVGAIGPTVTSFVGNGSFAVGTLSDMKRIFLAPDGNFHEFIDFPTSSRAAIGYGPGEFGVFASGGTAVHLAPSLKPTVFAGVFGPGDVPLVGATADTYATLDAGTLTLTTRAASSGPSAVRAVANQLESAVADDRHVYGVRGQEIVVVTMDSGSVCTFPVSGENVHLAVDDQCLYVVKRPRGNGQPITAYSLEVAEKVQF